MAAVGEACKERTKVRDDLEEVTVTVAVAISSSSKRRKVDESFTENSLVPAPKLASPVSSGDSTKMEAPPRDVDKDRARSSTVDLKKKEECATEIRTVDIREEAQTTSASSKLSSPETMESPLSAKTTTEKPSPIEMPTAAELEEFFAAAEKLEQKRFEEKYNFDISKDVPLEGRYQWIRLKP